MTTEADTSKPTSEIADLIASDDYWGEPVDPAGQFKGKAREEYFKCRREAWRNAEVVNKIGTVAFSLNGGGVRSPLEEGSDYPEIPSDSRRVIRVVMDSRETVYRGSKINRLSKEIEKVQGNKLKGFDNVAEAMLDVSVWWSYSAVAVRSAGLLKEHRIRRDLMYMRPDADMNHATCVMSINIPHQEYSDTETADRVIPILPVGTAFKFEGIEARVVRADLLEADGIVWRDDAPKKPPRDASREGFLLPKLLPRLHGVQLG